MPNLVSPVTAMFTIFQSGLVVSGNTRLNLTMQLTSGQALTSVRVSGADEFIQLFRMPGSKMEPLTGTVYQGAVSQIVAEEILIRRATYDVSGATNQANTILRQRVEDSKVTVASGVWASGFNLPRPYYYGEHSPMPSELFAKARLEWHFRYVM